MSRPASQSRLNHLEKSAYLLALEAPQTSAYLQAEYTRLLSEAGVHPSAARAGEVCGSCGTIMLPGLTAKIRKGANTSGSSSSSEGEIATARPSASVSTGRAHICCRCSAVTKYSIVQKPNNTLRSVKGLPEASTKNKVASSSTVRCNDKTLSRKEHGSTTRNKSSKGRAKARKTGGLQAMLAKSKSHSAIALQSVGFGMDLMDIVKKSH